VIYFEDIVLFHDILYAAQQGPTVALLRSCAA